jgi:hypothetical protein
MSPTIFWPGFSAVKSRLTRSGIGPAVLLGQRVPPRLRLAGLQAQLAHDPADGLVIDLLAAADQGRVNTPVPIFGVIGIE